MPGVETAGAMQDKTQPPRQNRCKLFCFVLGKFAYVLPREWLLAGHSKSSTKSTQSSLSNFIPMLTSCRPCKRAKINQFTRTVTKNMTHGRCPQRAIMQASMSRATCQNGHYSRAHFNPILIFPTLRLCILYLTTTYPVILDDELIDNAYTKGRPVTSWMQLQVTYHTHYAATGYGQRLPSLDKQMFWDISQYYSPIQIGLWRYARVLNSILSLAMCSFSEVYLNCLSTSLVYSLLGLWGYIIHLV